MSKTQWFTVILKVEHPESVEYDYNTTDMFSLIREGLRDPLGSKITVEEVRHDQESDTLVEALPNGVVVTRTYPEPGRYEIETDPEASGMSRIERILDDEMDLN